MFKYILKRLVQSVFILIGVSMIIYFLIRLMPVDFIQDKINAINQGGATVSQETVDAMYQMYGLGDDSFMGILGGYVSWLTALFQFDLGTSFVYGIPVADVIFEHMGISADGVAFEKYFRERLFDSAIPENGAMDLLKYLHGKYILCVASNGPYQQQKNRLKVGGMLPYFSDLFISEEIGIEKPGIGFFQRVWEKIGHFAPDEVMIVGDSLTSDIQGGNNAGILCCWFNPQGKPAPDNLRIDYTISSLNQILDIL